MPFDIYNKKFQNWLKGVFGLNTTRTALCECITDKLDNGLKSYSNEELHQYFVCLEANNISLLHTKSKGSTDKGWECEHTSCRDIMRYFIDNHKQGHKLKYTWAPIGKSESNGTVGCGNYCKELKWNVIKLYMHIENETVMKQCTSLDCLDITHVIKIMRNCKLISTNDLDEPLEEVLSSRNKFMHSPDNKMTAIETCNTIQCTRKLLDCLDIAEKDYYKNAAQELHDLSVNDFVLRYQSEECKRILADVLNARHLAVELNSNIKEDNLQAKSQSKRLQEKLENITGLRSTTNTNLEMKHPEYKRKSKECLEKKIDAIKLDQMECDKNSTEYTKLEDLKDWTEGALEEVIVITQRLESEEMVDEIEKLKNENETLKSEIKQNNSTTNTNLEMKHAEYKRKSKECLEKKIDAIKLDQMECDKNSTEYTKLEDLKDWTEGALEEVIVITQRLESEEMVDEIEKLKNENETLKSEIKQNNSTTNTNLEMKHAEYKRKSNECLEKKIDAIKLDQMECDKNSTEYTKLEDLKDWTEGALEEVIVITQRLESEEMVDEIEKLKNENETLKSEIKQNNTSTNTNLEMKLAEDKRKSNECLEKKIDGIKLDQIKCDKNSAEYTKLEELKDGIKGALEEEITTTNTNLEMKLAEDKRKSKEYLEKEIGAIKVDQMECDKNSAEYTKLEELKDGTEGVLEEEITTTNTNLEMKLAEDKRKSKECLEKKIDAIKTDQMECDKNSAEYTKLEELKDGTEGVLEEEITTTNTNLEMKLAEDKRKSKECLEKKIDAIKVDQMECDKNSAECSKLEELKDGTEGALEEETTTTNTNLEMKLAEDKRKSKQCLEKKIDAIKVDQMECDKNSAEYTKLEELKDGTEGALEEEIKDVGSLILLEKKEDSIDLENASLLNEIVWLLDMDRDAEVIMLIGQSGAGKSAMLNTIHRVLTRQYYTLAKQGTGHAGSVTQSNERYNNCGVYLETVRDDSRREKIAAVVHKLPHIVDCPGMGDDDSPALSEILELLVGGFIPHGTHIGALQSNQKEFGVGCLKKLLYINSNPADRVTKVVFIQSCRNAIPRNLINCLNEVLKIKDPKTMRRKYTAEVFLLISKFDLVHDPSVHISSGSDKDSMTIEDFIKMENELASEFNIVGVLEANRIIRWASYSDNIQGRNKYIENIALKFLRRMVQP